jgi:hypothetical protein
MGDLSGLDRIFNGCDDMGLTDNVIKFLRSPSSRNNRVAHRIPPVEEESSGKREEGRGIQGRKSVRVNPAGGGRIENRQGLILPKAGKPGIIIFNFTFFILHI